MHKKRLLLVDDEEGFTTLLKLNLEETNNYDVRVENDGAKALKAAHEFQPDLILLDVIMPDVDGGEVGAQIKADSKLKHVPVIYLTAIVSQKELDAQSRVIGGRLFVAKPVSKQVLIELIERQLAENQKQS
ncbi:MAG: response regulator [Candidatus Binatia bacterium]